jgi:hypothetical protein
MGIRDCVEVVSFADVGWREGVGVEVGVENGKWALIGYFFGRLSG